ncbi:hypothetical protein JW948_01175 [bacterium]|nr:hypothetical protein [bacterium]
MRSIPAILLLLSICTILRAQSKVSATAPLVYQPQGYVLESLGGAGFSNTVQSAVFNLSNSNPALLTDSQGISAGFSLHYETDIPENWIADLHHTRENSLIPQSAGLVIPVKPVVIGFGFHQKFRSRMDYGWIMGAVIDPSSPSGYADTDPFRLLAETSVFQFGCLAAYEMQGILADSDRLSLGIGLYAGMLSYKRSFDMLSDELSDAYAYWIMDKHVVEPGLSAGFRYHHGVLSWGCFYESGFRYRFHHEDYSDIYYEGRTPDKLHAGYSVNLSPRLEMNNQYTVVFWKNSTSRLDADINHLDYSMNLICHLYHSVSVSSGILHTDKPYHDSTFNSMLTANYLTFGIVLIKGPLTLDLVAADSRWLSEDWRKQTVFRAGACFLYR